MNKVHDFLITTYQKTKWPYFQVIGLELAFGPTTIKQLNQLRKEGVVKRRTSLNGTLVELIKTE